MKKLVIFTYSAAFFVIVITLIYFFNQDIKNTKNEMYQIAFHEATSAFNKDLAYRRWSSMHGGVYVPVDSTTPPNPYLSHISERDIETPTGRKLTLVNPAYMTRQVHEIAEKQYGSKGHITSLNPLRPQNLPDEWERKVLLGFEKGIREYSEITFIDTIKYFRYMKAMVTEKSCLKCHSHQGYKVGDIRGGISISLPWASFNEIILQKEKSHYIEYSVIFSVLMLGLFVSFIISTKTIKKLNKTEKEKVDTLHQLIDTIESMTDAFISIDTSWCYTYMNKNAGKIFNRIPENMIGKHIWTEFPEGVGQPFHLAYEKVMKEKVPYHFEEYYPPYDKWFENRIYPTNKGISIFFSDITEKKNSLKALQESENKFRSYINYAPLGIFIADKDGKYIDVNPAACTITGFTKEELLKMNLSQLIHNDYMDLALHHFNTVVNNGSASGEFKFFRKSGEIGYWKVDAVKLSETRFLGFVSDITEKKNDEELLLRQNKELEQQYEEYMQLNEVLRNTNTELERQYEEYMQLNEKLRQTNLDLVIAKDKAEESDRLKTAFLQNMSHEIRTPLNGIIGFSRFLMNKDISSEEIEEITSIINLSGKRLLELINNVIEIAKIETGQVEIEKRNFSLHELLDDVYSLFKIEADAKHLKLNCQVDIFSEDISILSDDTKILEVLSNLISNALKFTKSGQIDFGYNIKDSYIEFFVKDTGIGISPEYYDMIFNRFTQIDLSLTRGFEGAGLGLSICKGLVNLLGGSIWCESAIGAGTTFFFKIPLVTLNYDSGEETSSANSKKINNTGKVLIAEDDEISSLYLGKILENEGIRYCKASNGIEAVEIVKNDNSICMILMDIKMPKLDGIEAARKISEIRDDIIIIAQTAYAFEEERKRIMNSNFDEYISKPIEEVRLIQILKKYMILM